MRADSVEYYIIDPAGNITALVTSDVSKENYKAVAACIMENEPSVEQTGFISFDKGNLRLNMSGGEFCGNAAMSAAALYCELKGKAAGQVPVTVFPYKKPFSVTVNKNDNSYICECVFNNPVAVKEYSFCADGKDYTFPLVCFEGIMHIVADNTLSEEAARREIRRLADTLKAKALGIMLYNSAEKSLLPLVYVPAVDTLFLENSCASGSCALAAVLPEFSAKTDIKEPGGIICAHRTNGGIYLKSNIRIIKKCFKEV